MINISDRIKFFFCKEKELYSSLYNILGFYPRKLDLYKQALLHKSQSIKIDGKMINNERLEFLGDAVIEAVVSDIIYHRYPSKDEGFLTQTRSKLVKRDTLGKLSEDLGLDRLIKSANINQKVHNSYLAGNAFEAIVGAVYLDCGYDMAQNFLAKKVFTQHIDIDNMAFSVANFKSKMLEWAQKNKVNAEFVHTKTKGQNKDTAPIFCFDAVIEGIVMGSGCGFSKKEAQQEAAKQAIEKLKANQKYRNRIFAAKDLHTSVSHKESADSEVSANS